MNTIYLPIEIKSREFVSRLLIALETAKIKPCEIFIGYKGDVNFYAKNFNPGIYYGLSSTENLENLYLDITNPSNHKIKNLQTLYHLFPFSNFEYNHLKY